MTDFVETAGETSLPAEIARGLPVVPRRGELRVATRVEACDEGKALGQGATVSVDVAQPPAATGRGSTARRAP
jgi:hypothetical protein